MWKHNLDTYSMCFSLQSFKGGKYSGIYMVQGAYFNKTYRQSFSFEDIVQKNRK